MFRKFFMIILAAFFVICIDSSVVFAETQEVEARGEYTYGDRETREDAKRAALDDAKRNALEKVVVQVKAYSTMKKFNLVEDDIRSYTAGRMKIIDREFEFVGVSTCIVNIKAVIEFDLDEIKNDPNMPIPANSDTHSVNNQPVQNTPTKLSSVLNGATEWNGHYYKAIMMRMNWEQAKKFCESIGGHLATAETSDENEFIKRLVLKYDNGRKESYWVGAYNKDSIWRWVTGGMIAIYFDWLESPSNRNDRKMALSSRNDGRWISEWEGSSYEFICEWEKASDAHDSTL